MTISRPETMRGHSARKTYTHEFVDHLPDKLEEGVLYVSIRYTTAAHSCFCGCGREVVTPLHPTKWRLSFDGVSTSLSPSVGSWSLDCRSHYWLEKGRVCWAETYSDEKIRAVRRRDHRDEQKYYGEPAAPQAVAPVKDAPSDNVVRPSPSRWQKLLGWFGSK